MTHNKNYDPVTLGQTLAAWLARELQEGPESLGVQLAESTQPHNLNRFFREVYLFFLVPIRIAITVRSPAESEKVTASLAETSLELINTQLASFGARTIPTEEWRSLGDQRLKEYSQLLSGGSPTAADVRLLQLLYTNLGLPSVLPQSTLADQLQYFFAILLPYASELIDRYTGKSQRDNVPPAES